MYRKLSVGLLATTFFAVLVSTGMAVASQSVPQDRLSLVLGESCRTEGQACRNDNQCCSGTCQSRSILPWIPGKCVSSSDEYIPPQPTRPTKPIQPTQKPQPDQSKGNNFSQQQCQNMNQYTKGLETQLQKAEREIEKLREQVQAVQKQANQMCQIQEAKKPSPSISPPGNLPD